MNFVDLHRVAGHCFFAALPPAVVALVVLGGRQAGCTLRRRPAAPWPPLDHAR